MMMMPLPLRLRARQRRFRQLRCRYAILSLSSGHYWSLLMRGAMMACHMRPWRYCLRVDAALLQLLRDVAADIPYV